MSGCGCGTGSCKVENVTAADKGKTILQALAKCGGPCGTKDLVEATGLDKKVVSDEIATLKKKGLVDSPVRCKYGITEAGKASI